MAQSSRARSRRRRKPTARDLRRQRSAVVLWVVLAVAVLATIWWMREWRRSPRLDASKDAELGMRVVGDSSSYADNSSLKGDGPSPGVTLDGNNGEAAGGGAKARAGDVPPSSQEKSSKRGDGVRLAIVIDDFGRSLDEVRRFASLEASISFAVLPFETLTSEVVSLLRSLGAETLLHLPMQATGPQNPGPGALLLAMPRQELLEATRRALEGVGEVSGVNNHMGSAFTEDGEAMSAVLQVIAERELFFLDSRTSSKSVGFTMARDLGLAAAERSVFLDNDASQVAIRSQFQRLLMEGRRSGSAIAIGHPYANTWTVLEREVDAARRLGFEFVPVSVLLERSSSEF